MKPLLRTITTFTALGLALMDAAATGALRSDLRLNAPTTEGKVTQLTAQLLEQAQFAHRRFDDALAAKFLDRYIDSLDGSHELFYQSDIAEFHGFLPRLAEGIRSQGDTHPAHVIFDRYLQRIGERTAFVTTALAEEKFNFTGSDLYSFDRENAARPRDAAEARELWRQRLRADVLQEKLAGKKPDEFAQTLTHRYQRQVQTMKKLSADTVLEMYLEALAHVYDPHSDYMGHEELQSFNIVMNLSLAGIGATLQTDEDFCKIRELVPGGPAACSGKLKVGDRIVAVSQGSGKDATDLFDLPLAQAVELIRGPKGTDVNLTIIPAGAAEGVRKTVTIQRDQIRLDAQRAKASIVDLPVDNGTTARLGVIDLPAFYARDNGQGESATADVAKLIRKLESEKVRGLILDLRRNGGGSLEEAINLTSLFITAGPVVQTRDPAGHIEVGSDDGGRTLYEGPLIVLTSRFSASASEIVAGALQDYGRALIVGDSSTFGKGTVQTMLSLGSIMRRDGLNPEPDPGALKVTISKFYRPSGSSTQLRGVQPEIVLPSLTDTPVISEAGMKNPMQWDTVPSALFDQFDLVAPFVATLSQKSQVRVAADRDFAWLREDIARADKNRATKSVSLNEVERRREMDEAKERTKARDAERVAHQETVPPVYEITVQNATASGLPAPVKPDKVKTADSAANDDADNEAEPATNAQDLHLRETEDILADYVQLLHAESAPSLTQR
jgi:carboxyl-terminal processing protease